MTDAHQAENVGLYFGVPPNLKLAVLGLLRAVGGGGGRLLGRHGLLQLLVLAARAIVDGAYRVE